MDGRLRRSLNDGSLPTPPPSYWVRGFCGFVWDSQLRHATDAWNTALLPHHPTLSEGGVVFALSFPHLRAGDEGSTT